MKHLLIISISCISLSAFGQEKVKDSIMIEDAKKHVMYLASDSLKGRVNYSKEQREAAVYLAEEFTSYGLIPMKGNENFYQPFRIINNYALQDSLLYNVIGMLPGKSKKDEIVIFSAHYDHIKKGINGQPGLFNGANDDASGTAGVLMLAKYFAMRNDNERTILFCLFAGEELGLFGSKAFISLTPIDNIKTVINIEMIGVTNRVGKNAFCVTGSQYSKFKKILQRNLTGKGIEVLGDLKDNTNLYMRSDNYPFAMKGIPAHSIMCSDDKDPCYHQPCDDAERLDYENMTRIVQAIAKGCSTIISGKDFSK